MDHGTFILKGSRWRPHDLQNVKNRIPEHLNPQQNQCENLKSKMHTYMEDKGWELLGDNETQDYH